MHRLTAIVVCYVCLVLPIKAATENHISGMSNPEKISDSTAWRGVLWMSYASPNATTLEKEAAHAFALKFASDEQEAQRLMQAATEFHQEFTEAAKKGLRIENIGVKYAARFGYKESVNQFKMSVSIENRVPNYIEFVSDLQVRNVYAKVVTEPDPSVIMPGHEQVSQVQLVSPTGKKFYNIAYNPRLGEPAMAVISAGAGNARQVGGPEPGEWQIYGRGDTVCTISHLVFPTVYVGPIRMRIGISWVCVRLLANTCTTAAPGYSVCSYTPIEGCNTLCKSDVYFVYGGGQPTVQFQHGWLENPQTGWKYCGKAFPVVGVPCVSCYNQGKWEM